MLFVTFLLMCEIFFLFFPLLLSEPFWILLSVTVLHRKAVPGEVSGLCNAVGGHLVTGMSWRRLALESGGISPSLSPRECSNVDIWRGGWRAWILSISPQRFAVKFCFILERCFWTTLSEKCRALIPLRGCVSDSLKTCSTAISAYTHSYVDGVSLPL